jgi:hypothetical protein
VAPPDEGAARRGAVGASTFSIELVAPGKLGLVFSPDTTLKPFTVEALAETGLALSHPQVQPGCTLVAVQDKLLHDKTYTVGLETIRGAGRPLTLTFERAPSDFSAEPTSVIGSAGDEHVDTPRDAPMPAALHRALGRGSPALNLTVEPVRAETPDHASAPATLSRALTRASEGPFGPATADIINWVLPLLGPAGVTLSERPANLGYPSGSTLFREQHPLKRRRYGTTKKESLDKWKPLGGSGVKRFRLSPFSSQKVLTQRVGKVIRPGKLHDLKFYQYEVGKLGAKASRKDGQVLLYHVFLPDTASAASAAPPGNSSAAAAAVLPSTSHMMFDSTDSGFLTSVSDCSTPDSALGEDPWFSGLSESGLSDGLWEDSDSNEMQVLEPEWSLLEDPGVDQDFDINQVDIIPAWEDASRSEQEGHHRNNEQESASPARKQRRIGADAPETRGNSSTATAGRADGASAIAPAESDWWTLESCALPVSTALVGGAAVAFGTYDARFNPVGRELLEEVCPKSAVAL